MTNSQNHATGNTVLHSNIIVLFESQQLKFVGQNTLILHVYLNFKSITFHMKFTFLRN